ncbi:hypothetical protein QJS04_geneDACA019711 [Acorus gramineus]|uniref:BPL/LPL catalytic domain-containing protein n=1 Tax=Acorus gramineus TaxID=55184 RepID=A0AAV9BTC9_ACOGR|nr:hypothetical protein QJS04_geneDACA019711 [Acorus gramineus]
MNLVRTRAFPILQQLHLEERLLRTSTHNWCIINDGTDAPTIVMGSSGSPSELIEVESVLKDGIPVVKRFSGGGTVIVDSGTIFMSFICNKGDIPGLQLYPSPIMSWTGQLYGQILSGVGDFRLRENENRKNEERKRGKEWITPYQHKYAITIIPPKSDLQKCSDQRERTDHPQLNFRTSQKNGYEAYNVSPDLSQPVGGA